MPPRHPLTRAGSTSRATAHSQVLTTLQIFEKLADLQQWENVQSGRSVVKGPKGTVLQQHDEFTYHSRFAPGPIGAKVSEVEGAKVQGQTLASQCLLCTIRLLSG